ncbi:proline dehydrogenase family protein [Leptospirillum ferriphilum]|uniref:proline dehydrogenase family protein n=1 Tax=Leptospirillum ferriphilum TaxID=178606 RepID=UPI0009C85E34|nr:proline dehydrogenase family protein [Leptospirillum ferriphilum]OOH81589.1 hypothetical protein BOX30_04970 [Leptospirillum ferriphilum]
MGECRGGIRSPGEVHLLHGVSEPLREAPVGVGRGRVYLPVGDILPGMAYLIRRLLENTTNASLSLAPVPLQSRDA